MNQTAVEFLFEKLWNTPIDKLTWHAILEQAKEMQEKETCQFAVDWFQNCPIGGDVNSTEDAQQYYKERFKLG